MTNQLKTGWGIPPPAGALAAWGARAIYRENRKAYDLNHTKYGAVRKRGKVNYFDVQVLWDCKGCDGDTAATLRLTMWLDKTGLPRLIKECNEKYLTTDSADVIEFTDGEFALKASPRKSHGYLYIGAWCTR